MVEYGRDATVALNQAVSMGLKSRMALGLSAANTEQVAGMQGGVFDGTYSFVTWYPNWPSLESKAFVKAYLEKYGAYSEAAGVHYIGAQVLFAGIANANSIDADPVIEALEGREFDTIKGKITLRAYDHQAVQTYFIGKGMVSGEFPVPIYEPMQTYARRCGGKRLHAAAGSQGSSGALEKRQVSPDIDYYAGNGRARWLLKKFWLSSAAG